MVKNIEENSNLDEKSKKEIKRDLGCPYDELRVLQGVLCRANMELDQFGLTNEITVRKMVPKTLVKSVIELMHNHPMRAHPGRDETLNQIKRTFFWKGMHKDVDSYIKNCNVCNSYKGRTDKNVQLERYPIAKAPFERVSIDLLTNFGCTDRGNKAVLVCIDQLTLSPLARV